MGSNAPLCASWGAVRFAAYHEASYHYSQALALYAMRDAEKASSATSRMHALANACHRVLRCHASATGRRMSVGGVSNFAQCPQRDFAQSPQRDKTAILRGPVSPMRANHSR